MVYAGLLAAAAGLLLDRWGALRLLAAGLLVALLLVTRLGAAPQHRRLGALGCRAMSIGRWSLAALDCRDPRALADFYAAVTGWEVDPDSEDDWVQLRSDVGATLAFQHAPDHEPPVWPSADHPQQMHLDFDVPDLDAGEQQVLGLGARKAEVQPGESFRVFLDPSGHPFCLVREG